jgi:hypothetical protein
MSKAGQTANEPDLGTAIVVKATRRKALCHGPNGKRVVTRGPSA